jgi:hypothetical protein
VWAHSVTSSEKGVCLNVQVSVKTQLFGGGVCHGEGSVDDGLDEGMRASMSIMPERTSDHRKWQCRNAPRFPGLAAALLPLHTVWQIYGED